MSAEPGQEIDTTIAQNPAENGAENQGENGAKEESEYLPRKRLSGFASPDYWDSIGPNGLTRREEKSQQVKKLYSEGKFGDRKPGAGRPRKNKSVAEVV